MSLAIAAAPIVDMRTSTARCARDGSLAGPGSDIDY
jgi:hypothetical protein